MVKHGKMNAFGRVVLVIGLILLLASLSLTGCSKPQPTEPAAPAAGAELTGTIRISGAWALYPMMVKWGEEFRKLHPQVRIDISAGGAGKGATDALSGLVELGMVSRDISEEEIKQGAFFVPVVKDAVFPTINAKNPVFEALMKQGMTKAQFVALFGEGKAMTWGEATKLQDQNKIQVYTRSDSCGAAQTWAQYLDNRSQEQLQGVGVFGDPGVAEAVRRDTFGIGYNNLNYAYDARSGLPVEGIGVVPLDVNENGAIDPEEVLATKAEAIKAVQAGVFPSPPARDLYVMTKTAFTGLTKTFIVWVLNEGQAFVDEVGYIKLTEDSLNAARAKLAN